jgi:hypothetical protein
MSIFSLYVPLFLVRSPLLRFGEARRFLYEKGERDERHSMSEHIALNPVHPRLRPILFLLLVPVPTLFCSMCVDGWIGPGYGKSELGAAIAIMVISTLLVVLADRRPPGSLGLRLDLPAIRDFGIGIAIPSAQLGIIFGIEFGIVGSAKEFLLGR